MSDRETGKVKWFSDARGFGFIARDSGQDLFVHFSNIEGYGTISLHEGQKVEFDIEQGPKGLRAANVKAID
ncbi:MAG: cold-shock protein [Chloroflexota bacterium]